MEQTWFAFRAYNTQTLYGFGTAEEADKFEDILNADREINVYSAHPLSLEEATELKLEGPNARNDGLNLDDELRARADAE